MRKNQILGVIGAAMLTGTTILLLNRDNIAKYSNKWFASVSKDELEAERERVRIMLCSTGGDYSLATRLQNLLYRFDDEIRLREYGHLKPEDYGYPSHREHGWNLYKPD